MIRTDFENRLSQKLKDSYKLRMDIANFATSFIPRDILLDRTRNIHSYMLFCEVKKGKIYSSYWDQNSMKNIILNFLRTQYSSLDRPLFFVMQNEDQSIHIIESTIVREELLNNPSTDLNSFMINKALEIFNVLPKIYREL